MKPDNALLRILIESSNYWATTATTPELGDVNVGRRWYRRRH